MSAATLPRADGARDFALRDYPGINRFALDLIEGNGRANEFLPRAHNPRARRGDAALVAELRETNRRWGNDVEATLEAWSRGETLTLIAGQQVGVGGGPLYTLAKIASLLRIRDRFAAQGTRATVFFWLATEDHDWAEVSQLEWWNRDGLMKLRAVESPAKPFVVGPLALPETLRASLIEVLGEQPRWLQQGVTLRDSFAMLLAEVLRGRDVVMVDAMLPSLRRAGTELFVDVIRRHDELQSMVRERSAALEAAGYTPQVLPNETGAYQLLYFVDGRGERHPIRKDGESWSIGEETLSESALIERVRRAPEHISTGVLIRPLLQDLVFGSDSFVGGPSEVAYYGQLAPLHQALNVGMPWVALRGHALVGPERIVANLERFGLRPTELFQPLDDVLRRFESTDLERVQQLVDGTRSDLLARLQEIDAVVENADRGLTRSIERTRQHLIYHLDRLNARSQRAVVRRDAERARAIQRLLTLLAPDAVPQDRRVSWLSLYQLFGSKLVDVLVDCVEPDQPIVRISGIS